MARRRWGKVVARDAQNQQRRAIVCSPAFLDKASAFGIRVTCSAQGVRCLRRPRSRVRREPGRRTWPRFGGLLEESSGRWLAPKVTSGGSSLPAQTSAQPKRLVCRWLPNRVRKKKTWLGRGGGPRGAGGAPGMLPQKECRAGAPGCTLLPAGPVSPFFASPPNDRAWPAPFITAVGPPQLPPRAPFPESRAVMHAFAVTACRQYLSAVSLLVSRWLRQKRSPAAARGLSS